MVVWGMSLGRMDLREKEIKYCAVPAIPDSASTSGLGIFNDYVCPREFVAQRLTIIISGYPEEIDDYIDRAYRCKCQPDSQRANARQLALQVYDSCAADQVSQGSKSSALQDDQVREPHTRPDNQENPCQAIR